MKNYPRAGELADQIREIVVLPGMDPAVAAVFAARLEEGRLTRDENLASHFCAFFVPFNPDENKIFLVHHKKSGKWIPPGGHVDEGEDLLQMLNREIEEELGVENALAALPQPLMIALCEIENKAQPCKLHHDIYYLFETDGSGFEANQFEFLDSGWFSLEDALGKVPEGPNRRLIELLAMNF